MLLQDCCTALSAIGQQAAATASPASTAGASAAPSGVTASWPPSAQPDSLRAKLGALRQLVERRQEDALRHAAGLLVDFVAEDAALRARTKELIEDWRVAEATAAAAAAASSPGFLGDSAEDAAGAGAGGGAIPDPTAELRALEMFQRRAAAALADAARLSAARRSLLALCSAPGGAAPALSLAAGAPQAGLPTDGCTVPLTALQAELRGAADVWAALSAVVERLGALLAMPWADAQPRGPGPGTVRAVLEGLLHSLRAMAPAVQLQPAHTGLTARLKALLKAVPLLADIQATPLQERHREALLRLLGVPLPLSLSQGAAAGDQQQEGGGDGSATAGLDLGHSVPVGALLNADLPRHAAGIREVLRAAAGEAGVGSFLQALTVTWEGLLWDLPTHHLPQQARDQGQLLMQAQLPPHAAPRIVVRGWDAVLGAVDDALGSLGSMRLSPYFAPYAREAQAWERRLIELRSLADAWLDVQVCCCIVARSHL
jgi:hypothetical protein